MASGPSQAGSHAGGRQKRCTEVIFIGTAPENPWGPRTATTLATMYQGGVDRMDESAFQEQLSENHCWGCGVLNGYGLQIKSYWAGDEAVCSWHPKPYHMAGPKHVLNGGIIATVIDCHCICTAIAAAYRAEGRAIGTEPAIWYATGSLQVTYLRPTPIDRRLDLRAQIKEMKERKTTLICSLFADGNESVRGEVVAVRVPPVWREAQ